MKLAEYFRLWRHRRLDAAHARLIRRLTDDARFARAMADDVSYGRIGRWVSLERGSKVLELGCGPGRYAALLANLGFDVTAVDPVRFPEWDLIGKKHPVSFQAGIKAEALPFADGIFDHVACMGALLYFDDPGKSMAEMHRILKPGGRLILRTVNRGNLWSRRTGKPIDPASRHLFDLDTLAELLLDHGFEINGEPLFWGMMPPRFPAAWHFLATVILPRAWVNWASDRLVPEHRSSITVYATCR